MDRLAGSELVQLKDVAALGERFRQTTSDWARRAPAELGDTNDLGGLLNRLLLHNLKLWQLEDKIRNGQLPDVEVVHLKRLIDLENQARTERIEQIDRRIAETLRRLGVAVVANAPLHTESPGLILDRLSILALRVHMLGRDTQSRSAPPARQEAARRKLVASRKQFEALIEAAQGCFAEFLSGQRRYYVAHALKQYGPS